MHSIRKRAEGTADFFATPEEEGAYYPDNLKGNKFFNSIYAELLVIVVLIAAYIFVLHRQTTYDWVEGFANPFCNPLILVFAIFAGQRNRGAIKLQSSLAAGEPHHQPTDWQAPHLRRKHRLRWEQWLRVRLWLQQFLWRNWKTILIFTLWTAIISGTAMPRRTGGSGKQIWSTPIRPSALLLTLPIIKQGGFRIKQMR